MINPVHPATPHISAVRAWRFACELSAIGHKVVLLSAAQQGQLPVNSEGVVGHDWRQPFVLACESVNQVAERRARLAEPIHKTATVWRLLLHGGNRGAWTINAMQATSQLSRHFSPDVVWCTFGMMEAVIAAKRIGAKVKCPWVLDIKDNWELYVPRGLRRLMAWRTRGWTTVTTNARFTADKARVWQNTRAHIVYSGIDDIFFERQPDLDANPKTFCINLVGGIYFAEHLESFLAGVETWANKLLPEQRTHIVVRYLGGDGNIVSTAARRYLPSTKIEILGYVPAERMAYYCQCAAVNVYIAHFGTFHHKLLELLACGRPLMACPNESSESRALARQASGVLLEVADSTKVSLALSRLHQSWLDVPAQPGSTDSIRIYSWANQAKMLESVLAEVVSSWKNYER